MNRHIEIAFRGEKGLGKTYLRKLVERLLIEHGWKVINGGVTIDKEFIIVTKEYDQRRTSQTDSSTGRNADEQCDEENQRIDSRGGIRRNEDSAIQTAGCSHDICPYVGRTGDDGGAWLLCAINGCRHPQLIITTDGDPT